MVMPFYKIDVSFVLDVICLGGRWNSLPALVMLWSDVITISGRWNGHRVLVLLQPEFWTVAQNLIPYVRQMVLAYVLVQGWIIDPYI